MGLIKIDEVDEVDKIDEGLYFVLEKDKKRSLPEYKI